MKKTIKEVKEWLLENAVNESGQLDLRTLDFSDFKGDVFIKGVHRVVGEKRKIKLIEFVGDFVEKGYQEEEIKKRCIKHFGAISCIRVYSQYDFDKVLKYETPSTIISMIELGNYKGDCDYFTVRGGRDTVATIESLTLEQAFKHVAIVADALLEEEYVIKLINDIKKSFEEE